MAEIHGRKEHDSIRERNAALSCRGEKSRQTILVVEDEYLIRINIAEYLRDCGWSVIEAATADEAVAAL